MKKFIFLLLLFLVAVLTLRASDSISDTENQVKWVLNKISPSLLKVIAENAQRTFATGIAIEPDVVLTSALISGHDHEKISVETVKKESFPAKIIGRDPRTGITLLQLEKKVLTPAKIGSGATVGDWIGLVGAFYTQFPSIFQGIISSLSDDELILNAPVAPGSAGGAVVNKNGELIGVIRGSFSYAFTPDYTIRDYVGEVTVRSIKSGGGDLCYAVPIAKVQSISESLKKFGRIRRGWLGVSMGDDLRVDEVSEDSPAAKAGLQKGDEIRMVGGQSVKTADDLTKIIRGLVPGNKVKIDIQRDGKEKTLEAEIGELKEEEIADNLFNLAIPYRQFPPKLPVPAKAPKIAELYRSIPSNQEFVFSYSGSRQLGTNLMDITPELAGKFKVKEGYGLMISSVSDKSAAQKAGLAAGDIIVRANGQKTANVSDLRKVLNGLKDKEAVSIELYRDGQLKKFSIVPDKREDTIFQLEKIKDLQGQLGERLTEMVSAKAAGAMAAAATESAKRLAETNAQVLTAQQALMAEQARMTTAQQAQVRASGETAQKIRIEIQSEMEKEQLKLQAELKKMQAEQEKVITEIKKQYEEQIKKLKEELEKLKKSGKQI